MKILLIGGAGYIGSRLRRALEMLNHDVAIVDPEILTGKPDPIEDVRELVPSQGELADVTVWLASIHDVSEDEAPEWGRIAHELMVRLPQDWNTAVQARGKRFIYFSSMRAATHKNRLYGWMKALAESVLRGATILRPGTVWGGLAPSLPNRTHTLLNRMLVQPQWRPEPHTDPFFTCNMKRVVHAVTELIEEPRHAWSGLTIPLVDQKSPITGKQIVEGWRPQGWSKEMNRANTVLMGKHPMELYRQYYLEAK